MLRLYGAGLSYERILTIKSKNRLGSHALGLLPAPISGVVMIVEMNYVFKVGSVSFVWQPILWSHSIDHLDWMAGGERRIWLLYDNLVADESFCSCFSYWHLPMHSKVVCKSLFQKATPALNCCNCYPRVRIFWLIFCRGFWLLKCFVAQGWLYTWWSYTSLSTTK